jgi:hypothetical protein
MAISKKPQKKELSEKEVSNLINKGGSVAQKEPKPKDKSFQQIRIKPEIIQQIDDLIDKRIIGISRHAWFMEAIEDKIRKERGAM